MTALAKKTWTSAAAEDLHDRQREGLEDLWAGPALLGGSVGETG